MIIIGIGSNLPSKYGDRFKNIDLAISFIQSYGIKIIKRSSFYETPSFPNHKNPKYINIVASISTHLPPVDLVSVTLFIEEKLERKRNKKNEPRTLDIDIIDYNGENMDFEYNGQNFTVPHASLSSRNFVLFPLKEIIPDWIYPKTKENINILINKLSEQERNSILKVTKS